MGANLFRVGSVIDCYDTIKSIAYNQGFGVQSAIYILNQQCPLCKRERLQKVYVRSMFSWQPHPCRTLLYLEWLILGSTILGVMDLVFWDFVVDSLEQPPNPLPVLLAIAGFGFMGMRLPQEQLRDKWFYLALCIALIAIPIDFYSSRDSLWGLFLIIVIRIGLMFERKRTIWIVSALFVGVVVDRLLNDTAKMVRWDITAQKGLEIEILPQFVQQPDLTVVDLFWQDLVLNPIRLGLMLTLTWLALQALLAERRNRRQLALAHEQLRSYALRVEDQSSLQERHRIARDIHDSLGHLLTAQRIQLENVSLFLGVNPDKATSFLQESQQLAAQALHELRQSVAVLRSDPLQGRLIQAAIADLAAIFQQRTGVLHDCQIDLSAPVSGELRTTLYRITQEALTNSAKYSNASQVSIRLFCPKGPLEQRRLRLIIEDNGQGFDVEQNCTGFGLQGMRERVAHVVGQLQVMSQPGAGCKILADFPLTPLSPEYEGVSCRQ